MLNIQADNGDGIDTVWVRVNVTDVNEPHTLQDASWNVNENSSVGTTVGTFVVSDIDGSPFNGPYSYTILTAGVPFSISGSTLRVNGVLDYESTPVLSGAVRGYSFQVSAGDGVFTAVATITVQINNLSEAPVGVAANFSVEENNAGAYLGLLQISNGSAGITPWSFSNPSDNRFEVTAGGHLSLMSGVALDYETTPGHQVTFNVTVANAEGSGTVPVTVTVLNVNERPNLNDTLFVVNENFVGATAHYVVGSDPESNITTYYLLGTGGPFSVATSGRVSVTGLLDYETDTLHTFQVIVQDAGGLRDTALVTVRVANVPENPGVADQTFYVLENEVASAIGQIAVTQVGAGVAMTWSIISGDAGNRFQIDDLGNISLRPGISLDYEAISVFTLVVRVATVDGASEAVITVRVVDVNEAPVLSNATFTPGENHQVGTTVGTLTATDPESNITGYTILNGSGLPFSVSNTGAITLTSALDFETTPTYSFQVVVTDGQYSDTATVTVNVQDENEKPVIGSATLAVTENLPVGTVVGVLTATDPERDHPYTWVITGGDGASFFEVVATSDSTAEVRTLVSLNHEESAAWDIRVRATDSQGTHSDVRTFTVQVNDANDLPVVTAGTFTVVENSVGGTVVGQVTATDEDVGQTLTYSIVTGGDYFEISQTGQVTVKAGALIDFEVTPVITLVVQVSDGIATVERSIQVSVGDVFEPTLLELIDVVVGQTHVGTPDTVWTNKDTVTLVIRYDDSTGTKTYVITIDERGDTTLVETWIQDGAQDSASVQVVVLYNEKMPLVEAKATNVATTPTTNKATIDSTGRIWTNDPNQTFDLLAEFVDQRLRDAKDSVRTANPIAGGTTGFTMTIVNPSGATGSKLAEGENLVIVRYTDVYGNSAADTLRVMLDTGKPVVKILNPENGDSFERVSTPVDWTVDGVLQDSLVTENLILGDNLIIRCFTDLAGNTGADTVRVVVLTQGNEVKISVEKALVESQTTEVLLDYIAERFTGITDKNGNTTPNNANELASKLDYAITIRNQETGREELLLLQTKDQTYDFTGTAGEPGTSRSTFPEGGHAGVTLVLDLSFPLSGVLDKNQNLQGVSEQVVATVDTAALNDFLREKGVNDPATLRVVTTYGQLVTLLGGGQLGQDAVTELEQLLGAEPGTFAQAEVTGTLVFRPVSGGGSVEVVRMVAMWVLRVQDINLGIFDNIGQYIRSLRIPGFEVDLADYQKADGSVRIFVEILPQIADGMMYGVMTDKRGRAWGSGAYLLKGVVRTAAVPAEGCAECKERRFTEEVVKVVGFRRVE